MDRRVHRVRGQLPEDFLVGRVQDEHGTLGVCRDGGSDTFGERDVRRVRKAQVEVDELALELVDEPITAFVEEGLGGPGGDDLGGVVGDAQGVDDAIDVAVPAAVLMSPALVGTVLRTGWGALPGIWAVKPSSGPPMVASRGDAAGVGAGGAAVWGGRSPA